MSLPDQEALGRFAGWYGLDLAGLQGGDRYRIAGAGETFDGRIACIQLTENGRFGNILYQIIHAVLLGDQVGVRRLRLFPFVGGPQPGLVQAANIQLLTAAPDDQPLTEPTLVGHFFNSYPFGTMLRGLHPGPAWSVLQPVLAGLFGHIQTPAMAATRPGLLVAHFRAGDIFAPHAVLEDRLGKRWWSGAVNPWYVQAPASFYLAAIRAALESGTVSEIRLVFEDRGNPAVDAVAEALSRDGVACTLQSQDLQTDLIALAAAEHLIASASTMIEAAALLAPQLRSYTSFRAFESHGHIHGRVQPLFAGLLRARGVQLSLYRDAGDYIPALRWDASPEQLALLRSYPAEKLQRLDGEDALAAEAGALIDPVPRLHQAEEEAARLRQTLLTQRAAAEGYRAKLDAQRTDTELWYSTAQAWQARAEAWQTKAQAFETSRIWRLTRPVRRLLNTLRH